MANPRCTSQAARAALHATLGGILLALLVPVPLQAADNLYRAAINGTVVSISPPALVREGRLFVPLEFLERGLGVSLVAASGAERELRFFGQWAKFGLGRTELESGVGRWTLGAAPFLQDESLYVPADLVENALGVPLVLGQDATGGLIVQVNCRGARLGNVSLEEVGEGVRLTVGLGRETPFQWRYLGEQVEVSVPLPIGEALAAGFGLEGFRNPHLGEVERTVEEGRAVLTVGLVDLGAPVVTALANPPRIVIDLPPAPTSPPLPPEATVTGPAPAGPAPLPPGAPTWQRRNFLTERGPVNVFVMRVLKDDPRWRARPALAAETVHTRHSVAYITRQLGAIAGINGGFFASQGAPVGMLVIEGEWITTPLKNRTMLASSQSGQLRMGRWSFAGRVRFEGKGFLTINELNRNQPQEDGLYVYTRRWANTLPGNVNCVRLAVNAQGVVVIRETQGRAVDVPAGGYLLSGRGRQAQALAQVAVGEVCRVELGTDPAWPELWWAVEGGPRLLADGRIQVTGWEEGFKSDVCVGCASRSAAGITKEGDLLLVAVESPGTDRGGVTLKELALMMQKLGAWQAMNLDGGGSTTVVQNGQTINRVRGGSRLVSNAIVVVPR